MHPECSAMFGHDQELVIKFVDMNKLNEGIALYDIRKLNDRILIFAEILGLYKSLMETKTLPQKKERAVS
jgi:hypothetical protein